MTRYEVRSTKYGIPEIELSYLVPIQPVNKETSMKQLLTFIKKEFHHVLRDRKTLLILFGLPVVQIIIFGFALSNEVKNAKIVVVIWRERRCFAPDHR